MPPPWNRALPPVRTRGETSSPPRRRGGFERTLGLRSAVAVNMTQMCGIGPFVTIPLMIAALGGPQAIFGWIVGALLALVDGLVWAELGAAMPGAGGTYLYLREAFQYRTGRLMPFLFVWTAMFTIPLIMSTGVIGLVQYLGFLTGDLTWVETHARSPWRSSASCCSRSTGAWSRPARSPPRSGSSRW